MDKKLMRKVTIVAFVCIGLMLSACTQESQNKLGRSLQNWTGTNGVLDIYMGGTLVQRFIKIDKLSTAVETEGGTQRDYRYGYGYLDLNQNFKVDEGERKLYFEISNYSTPYVFYDNPGSK